MSASTGSCSSGQRGRVFGVPKKCWCGEEMSTLTSRSDTNPYRRYYRCSYAAEHRLKNDPHTFKWVDDACLNEISELKLRNQRLEQEVKEIRTEFMNVEKIVFERVQMKIEKEIEKEIFERVEEVLDESKANMKKMMMVVVLGCMIMGGCIKLLG